MCSTAGTVQCSAGSYFKCTIEEAHKHNGKYIIEGLSHLLCDAGGEVVAGATVQVSLPHWLADLDVIVHIHVMGGDEYRLHLSVYEVIDELLRLANDTCQKHEPQRRKVNQQMHNVDARIALVVYGH
jgi:hypothetical protein